MIEVILRQDVDHLGQRGDIVKVASGFARNYLLPRKLALAVSEGNRRQIDHERKLAAAREADERKVADALAERIGQATVTIARKVGETETLYGSVTSSDIADALAAQGIEVDRRRIQLDEPLKHIGETTVPIKLQRDVIAQLRVAVVKDQA